MTTWRPVGPVIKTQIHTDRMVNGGVYEHDKILTVDELHLGPDGVVGLTDGRAVLHAHHRLHPNKTRAENTKQFLPGRLLSFGFTAHYAAMAERFGQAPIGCAAEDVIVEADDTISLADLAGGIRVRRGDRAVELAGPQIAKPCVPFTKFMLGDQSASDEVVAPNREFLQLGRRGFLVGLADQASPATIRVGDMVEIRPAG